jgi:hypothetical protein
MTTRRATPAPDQRTPAQSDDAVVLAHAVARLNGAILGLTFGILGAALIFALTNWLVIKGGDPVGPHLALLGQYFIGYRVTFVGSLVGAAYAFVIGYVTGRIVGSVYNRVADMRDG